MDWLVAPRLARKAQARQSPQRRPRDASFSSVTSDDDHFGRPLVGAVHKAISVRDSRDPPTARAKRRASLDAELIVGLSRDAVYSISEAGADAGSRGGRVDQAPRTERAAPRLI